MPALQAEGESSAFEVQKEEDLDSEVGFGFEALALTTDSHMEMNSILCVPVQLSTSSKGAW